MTGRPSSRQYIRTGTLVSQGEALGSAPEVERISWGQDAHVGMAYSGGEHLNQHFVRGRSGNGDPLKDWIGLIDEDGWVAREQILGEEARSKVSLQIRFSFPDMYQPLE